MSKRHPLLLAGMCLLFLFNVPVSAVAPPGGVQTRYTVPHLDAQILVKPVPGTAQSVISDLLAPFAGVVVEFVAGPGLYVATIDDDTNLEAAITLLETDPRIEYAQPNYLFEALATPNDLDFAQQWSKDNAGFNAPGGLGTPGADMNMVAAWDTRTSTPGVVIAVIDDGVETTHVDLVGNVLGTGKCFASPGSQRPCSNGPNDPNPADNDDFHGTLVSGTAAARGNNGIGVAGTAWESNILPLKVDLTSLAIVEAIDEAIVQGADIINMSFGGPVQGAAQAEALARAEAAGILAVASAGNADANNDIATHYPSDAENRNVLSVAATNSQDKIAQFSQWAPFSVDIAAPGEQIRTTAINNSYGVASGTSFSAPHIAGVAALVKEETAAPDYRRVKAHLLYGGVNGVSTLGPVVPGQNKRDVPGRVASGRIDADRALSGPPGGVLLVRGVSINDAATGNGNGVLEPGETALMELTVENIWTAETTVTGVLSTPDTALLSVNEAAPVLIGSIAQDSSATASFNVTLSATVTGNEQIFLQLDLSSATSPNLPSRYFYFETGTLTNGNTVAQQIQRWDWDEFQAYTVNVPVGATQLNIATTGTGDVDLLVRRSQSPEYLINLGGGNYYYVDSETQVSSGPGASESITIANPLPGVYHVVVVNFDQLSKTYNLTASFVPPNSGSISFSAATYSESESAGNAVITVTRSGGVDAASVDFATAPGSATPQSDYTPTSGTLNWAVGENGPKTFEVALLNDQVPENTETVTLNLANAVGASLGVPATATLQINDDDGVSGSLVFTAAQYSVNESGGNVQIGVSRTGGSFGAASVNFSTQAGSATAGADYTTSSSTLTWADGESDTKTVMVPITADTTPESTETFTAVLSNALGATIGTPGTATVAIADDDNAPASSGGGGGGSTGIIFLVFLSSLFAYRRRVPHP